MFKAIRQRLGCIDFASVLVVQGSLTLGAGSLDAVVTGPMISATTATGGILIFGLGLLEPKEVRVANMLPALLFAPLLVAAAPFGPSSLNGDRRCW